MDLQLALSPETATDTKKDRNDMSEPDSLEKMINDAPKIAAKIIRALAVSLSKRLRMPDGQLLSQQV